MSGLDEARNAYQQVYNCDDSDAKFSYELIVAAAAFVAMRELEKQQREESIVIEHALAKEILAGMVAAEVMNLIETRGEDDIDQDEARRQAEENACNIYVVWYEDGLSADQYDSNQYEQPDFSY